MRQLFILICNLFCIYFSLAAQADSTKHSKILKDFVVYTDMKKYQAGAKIENIPTDQLQEVAQAGLDQALMRFTPIYIKSNAGGLSTIRLRGTSANHTSINFGGINVNSLTLGHSNMSSVPVYLFDGLDLQYGSASAINGSGSIGGAINLGLQSNWTNGCRIEASNKLGSFGEHMYGIKVFCGNGKFESVTRAYSYMKENDFPFTNYYSGDIEDRSPKKDTQHGARINNKGLLQELNYKFRENEFWRTALWLENDWHEVQPNMSTNYHFSTAEEIEDQNIRLWSEYKNERHSAKLRTAIGYVNDNEIYENINTQTIGTERIITEIEVNQDLKQYLGYKLGGSLKHITPHVYSYSDSLINNEQHWDAYFSTFLLLGKRIKLTLNLRQMWVSNYSVPFTPSIGTELKILDKEHSVFKILANVSRSYRIPTFNDRFWGNQGNPDLKPEDGTNYECGVNYAYCTNKFQWNTKLNAFYMDVKNWIEWRNFGIWQAQNLMEVESKGLEFSQQALVRTGNLELNAKVNFSYNIVEALKDISESGTTGVQLIYTPKQMGNGYISAKYKNWILYTDGSYTGIRNADYLGNRLPQYYLLNAGINKQFKWRAHELKLSVSCQNMLDKNYQNERYYAMPGRSYRIGLSINLNYLKTKQL